MADAAWCLIRQRENGGEEIDQELSDRIRTAIIESTGQIHDTELAVIQAELAYARSDLDSVKEFFQYSNGEIAGRVGVTLCRALLGAGEMDQLREVLDETLAVATEEALGFGLIMRAELELGRRVSEEEDDGVAVESTVDDVIEAIRLCTSAAIAESIDRIVRLLDDIKPAAAARLREVWRSRTKG